MDSAETSDIMRIVDEQITQRLLNISIGEDERRELARWRSLTDGVRELRGYSPSWPDHGNAPLAIISGYALLLRRVGELERGYKRLQEALHPFARARPLSKMKDEDAHPVEIGDLRRARTVYEDER